MLAFDWLILSFIGWNICVSLKRINGINLILLTTAFSTVLGLLLIADELDNKVHFYISFYALGIAVVCAFFLNRQDNVDKDFSLVYNSRQRHILTLSLLFFCALHYSRIGIPFFSGDIDELRFKPASSGLFGIPSRVALFSPLVFTAFFLFGNRIGIRNLYRFLYLALAIVLYLFQGHKSAVLNVVIFILTTFPLLKFQSRKKLLLVAVVLLMVAVLFAYMAYIRMPSVEGFEMGEYLLARFSSISFQPTVAIFEEMESLKREMLFRSPFFNDIFYFILKSLGLNVYTFNSILSFSIYNVDAGDFTVPVTPILPAYFLFDFGYVASIFIALIFVYLFKKYYLTINNSTSFTSLLLKLIFGYSFFLGINSGNLFYAFISPIPFYLVLIVIDFVSRIRFK